MKFKDPRSAARLASWIAAYSVGLGVSSHATGRDVHPAIGSNQAFILQTSPQDDPGVPPLPARGLRSWVKTGSAWKEVPVQIDERDENGDFVLEHGIPFTANGGDGIFNGSDELTIALPAGISDLAPAEAKKKLQQLAQGSRGRLSGWFVRFSKPPSGDGLPTINVLLVADDGLSERLSPEAIFDPSTQTVTTSRYRYRFNAANPAAVGELTMQNSPGLTGLETSQKEINQGGGFAVWLKPPWGFPSLHKSDRDLTGAIESWRTGPVRTIVAVGSKYSALWSTIHAHLFSELVFYRDRFQIPSVIDVSFSPNRLLGKGSGFAYGLKLANPGNPVIQQGKGAAAGSVAARHQSGLVLRARTDPALVSAGVVPAIWLAPSDPKSGHSNVQESDEKLPPPVQEWFRQTSANIGFFVDISRMKKGRYDFSLDLESQGEANLPHTDFLICKSVWTPLDSAKSTKTVAPVPKQESKSASPMKAGTTVPAHQEI